MSALRALIFDLDGTLVETAPEILDAVNDALGRFGLPEVSQQMRQEMITMLQRSLLSPMTILRQ